MSLPAILTQRLRLPVMASPLFIVSNPDLVIAQCKAGVVGSFPALNARPASALAEWLDRITGELAAHDRAHPERPSAPFAVNQIVHKSNDRLEHDTFAHKAIDKGADGLIAVAAGAGGHAGFQSPLALIQEIRQWFDGPLLLSGSITTGRSVLAAQAMGADMAYIGSAFIATREANAGEAYKKMITECSASDIVHTNLITGVHGNYLKPSLRAAGLDPDNLPTSDPSKMSFASDRQKPKAWKDIWGCGQGIGAIDSVVSAGELVDRLEREYRAARETLAHQLKLAA